MDQEREDYADPPLPRLWSLPSWGIVALIALVLALAAAVCLHNAVLTVE